MARAIGRWFLTFELFVVLSTLYMYLALNLVVVPIVLPNEAGYALAAEMVQRLGFVFGMVMGLAFVVLYLASFAGVFVGSRWIANLVIDKRA